MSPKDLDLYRRRNRSMNVFNDIFDDMFGIFDEFNREPETNKTVDNQDGTTTIKFNLSGFSKEDVELSENNGCLNIKASKSTKNKKAFSGSTYHESFYIGDAKIINAEMNNGLLEVTIEEREDKSRSIEIK